MNRRQTFAMLAFACAASMLAGCEERSRQWSMSKVEPSASGSAAASVPPASTTGSSSAGSAASATAAGASASASGNGASVAASGSAPAGAVPQLHYGVVTLSATLTEQTFAGPPTYGSDPAHDAKDNVLVLQLFAPVDVLRTDGDDDWNDDRVGVRKISIASTKTPPDDLHKLVGKAIKVKGKIYGAHSPKDHTDVVMSDVELVPE
jgi:hypothetical protein